MAENDSIRTTTLTGRESQILASLGAGAVYRRVPYPDLESPGPNVPVWRVQLYLAADPSKTLALEINGEAVLGRGYGSPELVDLTPMDAENMGVSRRHVMFHPTIANLFISDLGSTNGSLLNSEPVGGTPRRVVNGDSLTLGRLKFVMHIVSRPSLQPAELEGGVDVAGAVAQIARVITSQLDLEDVLNQVAETAMKLASAGEAGVWLVDEHTGELFLEAQRGIFDEKVRRMRLPLTADNPAGQVVKTGKPLRANRQPGEEQIKVKTGYLVEALLFEPIHLGGVVIGVLAAVHNQQGKMFTERDERLLGAIADFAAIAIQNARLYRATDDALERRVTELAALNELSRSVSSTLDVIEVHDLAVQQLRQHWQVEDAALWMVGPEGQVQPFVADEEKLARLVQGADAQVAALVQKVIDTHQPQAADFSSELTLSGAQKDPRKATVRIAARSLACVPLMAQGKAVGVLGLFKKKHGMFNVDDLEKLAAFGTPVAAAIENARLFVESERQRAAIQATAQALTQPLIILDDHGVPLIYNQPAEELVESHLSELFEGLRSGVNGVSEMTIGKKSYLGSMQHNEGVGTIIVMQDISYVKKLERETSELFHTMSHDLKTPLSTIKGYAELIPQAGELSEKQAGFLAMVVEGCKSMLHMINGTLQTIRKQDTIQLTRQVVDLQPVIERVVEDMRGATMMKSITMNAKVEGTPYQIIGDGARMYHMILNLCDNAVKYSPEKTRVDVELAFTDEAVILKVRDQGPGIPPDDLPQIFDKYYRGVQGEGEQPGAGIGLSVVKGVAEGHGGTVEARNRPKGGTEFVVTLPASLRVRTEQAE